MFYHGGLNMKGCQKKITNASHSLISALINIDTLFKTGGITSSKKHSLSVLSSILFFKKHKIPTDYQTILTWLADIARNESFLAMKGEAVNDAILTKALEISLQYIRSFPKSDKFTSSALIDIMSNIINQFTIPLKHSGHYDDLEKYCLINRLTIPQEIEIINTFMTNPSYQEKIDLAYSYMDV